ncbi:MAG: serine/threonine-protein kinase, partial [Myxococcota bacterium]
MSADSAERKDQPYPPPGSVIAGKYEVVRLIGRGGMGAVLEALHTRTERRVAIKWLLPELVDDDEAVARFEHEAKASGRIDHPNVVGIHDFGEFEGSYYLVMDYLHGGTLGERLEQGPLPVAECIQLLMPVLRGVAAAHEQGVIHRDMKPDNIFLPVDRNGMPRPPKVLDFGISKLERHDKTGLEITRAGEVVGTPYYMSPEQSQGKQDVDGRTDIFSLGVILYECLAGVRPFTGESYAETLVKIATEDPVPVDVLRAEVPSGLAAVVETAMAKAPRDRYGAVNELGRALEPFAVHGFDQSADWTGSFSATGTRAVVPETPSAPPPRPPIYDDEPVELPARAAGAKKLVLGLVALLAVAALAALAGGSDDAGEPEARDDAPAPV